jgi:hypothetical protein
LLKKAIIELQKPQSKMQTREQKSLQQQKRIENDGHSSLQPPPFQLKAYDGGKDKKKGKHEEPKRSLGHSLRYRKADIKGPIAESDAAGKDCDKFSPNDVEQGNLGDCYLMASLASLARTEPATLEKMITPKPDGSYDVKLVEMEAAGAPVWTTVNVTSNFVTNRKGEEQYAQSGDQGELWVMLVEKAYSQLKGGYPAIDGGYSVDALATLTGRGSDRIAHGSSPKALLEGLAEAQKAGQAMTASTPDKFADKEENRKMEDLGVFTGHCYSLVGVEVAAGTVELQNPWYPSKSITLTVEDYRKGFEYTRILDKPEPSAEEKKEE